MVRRPMRPRSSARRKPSHSSRNSCSHRPPTSRSASWSRMRTGSIRRLPGCSLVYHSPRPGPMAPVKEVAQIGSAVGREFSARLLALGLGTDARTLDADLAQLVEAGLLVSRGDELYAFTHALTRDAAYSSLLKSRREIYHQRIAHALEAFDDGLIRSAEPELLAYHFEEAGNFSPALAHWIAAGDVAERRGATEEATAHYRSAKKLTESTDLPAADRARAAEGLMKLGNAQMQTAGYHSAEVLQL